MKGFWDKLLRFFLKFILSFFFKKEYLSGRFFDRSFGGYVWAFRAIWTRNILRIGRTYSWPVCPGCTIVNEKNISFDVDDINNFQVNGVYFQNSNGFIHIGKGSYIAPNVGIITSNHDLKNLRNHDDGSDVVIGEGCWIGMNSIILPGVILGDRTIVGAGSVVTKSFLSGNVVICGSPARVLKKIY